jgi:acylphosphatase
MHQALLKITGRVQGVFYRSNAREAAKRLGLTGYAKNMPDGSVEALVQGEKSQIIRFVEWCKEGSPSANVNNIETIWQTPESPYNDFETY